MRCKPWRWQVRLCQELDAAWLKQISKMKNKNFKEMNNKEKRFEEIGLDFDKYEFNNSIKNNEKFNIKTNSIKNHQKIFSIKLIPALILLSIFFAANHTTEAEPQNGS